MSIQDRLRADLSTALRSRDKVETSMLRTLIGAIDNAGAVEATQSAEPKIGTNHDVPRRDLTEGDLIDIVGRERAEVEAAIDEYRELGLKEHREEMELRLKIVDRYL